jgi:hypothetical protein
LRDSQRQTLHEGYTIGKITFFLIVDFDPMIRLVLSRLPVIRLVNFCEQLICTLNVVQGEIEPFGQIFAILFIQVDHVSGQKSVPDMLHIKMNLPPCFFEEDVHLVRVHVVIYGLRLGLDREYKGSAFFLHYVQEKLHITRVSLSVSRVRINGRIIILLSRITLFVTKGICHRHGNGRGICEPTWHRSTKSLVSGDRILLVAI